jgi:hypothetical protein
MKVYAGFEKINRFKEQVEAKSRQQRVVTVQVDQDMERLRRIES